MLEERRTVVRVYWIRLVYWALKMFRPFDSELLVRTSLLTGD